MLNSSLNKENTKSEDELIPPPLNILLPRLIPKELSNNTSSNINSTEKFISRKRLISKEESKSQKIYIIIQIIPNIKNIL